MKNNLKTFANLARFESWIESEGSAVKIISVIYEPRLMIDKVIVIYWG